MADIHIHLPLAGNTQSNAAGPPARSGLAGIRRAAMAKIGSLEPSDGEKESITPPPKAAANNVTPNKGAVKAKPDKNKQALERVPPFAKDNLAGDGWAKASQKARARYKPDART
jgi:hypothetical protein